MFSIRIISHDVKDILKISTHFCLEGVTVKLAFVSFLSRFFVSILEYLHYGKKWYV